MFIQGTLMKNLISLTLLCLMLPSMVIGDDTSIDGQFATPTSMTDKQMDNAKNFTHQGVKDRVIKEGCAKVNDCQEDDGGFPLEQVIGKAYSMIGMFTGDGMVPKLSLAKTAPASGAAAPSAGTTPATGTTPPANGAAEGAGSTDKAKKEEKNDYCMMIAMGYELVGGALQTSLQKKAENKASGINDAQLASLVNLKETHKARATTASWQRNIYAGVTACYAYQMISGGLDMSDPKLYLKVAGAGALTVLYQKKVSKHKDAADKVQLVIDSLPKVGDCNPWTGTKCFCGEVTSKDRYPGEYQEVCVLNNGNFETPKVALGCGAVVDKKVSFDKECKCKATNTCIKGSLSAVSGLSGLGTNMLNEANKNFDLLNSGEFDQGKFDSAALSASTLAARVKLPTPKNLPKVQLTDDQKKMAAELSKYAPPGAAALAAASNGSGFKSGIADASTSSAAVSKLSPEIKQKLAQAIKVNYKSGGGNDIGTVPEEEFTLPGFGAKPEEAQGGTEVLSFAEQAVSKADVSNSPETPIFDIISNRYRRSGWNKLDTVGK
jgi:hypothetical protein